MAATKKEWVNNAFWNNPEKKDNIEAILTITEQSGRVISQQLSVRKKLPDGTPNPDFVELIDQLSEEIIDKNTTERSIRKKNEEVFKKEQDKAKERARELEKLFDHKIKIMEIETISNSKNRELKSKLRRSKNTLEMQMYAQLIMMEENGYTVFKKEDPDERTV